jgi:hypothetical protein
LPAVSFVEVNLPHRDRSPDNGHKERHGLRRLDQETAAGTRAVNNMPPPTETVTKAAKAAGAAVGKAVKHGAQKVEKWLDAVPGLIAKHTPSKSPALFTLYLQMGPSNLGKTAGGKQKTGVFVPESVKGQTKLNLIIYLHGNKVREVHDEYTIEEIWGLAHEDKSSRLLFPLREELNDSKKPFILVAPTLGKYEQGISDLGNNVDVYLNQVMEGLHEHAADTFSTVPLVGDIIIAGHSGAGGQMLQVASGTNNYKENIKEIWGFDTMLDGTEEHWRNWALGHSKTTKVYVYYRDYAKTSLLLAKNTMDDESIWVMEALAEHDFVLQKHWRERVNAIGSPTEDDRKRRDATRDLATGGKKKKK